MTRYWEDTDKPVLCPMIRDCLAVNYAEGADMLPTERNTEVLWELGISGAKRGDPCLVKLGAVDRTAIIGYTLWTELQNPLGLDYGYRVLHGFGTYIREDHRRAGVSMALRHAAESLAAARGFEKIVGAAYHEAGLASVRARGYRIAAFYVEKDLRC